MIACLFLVSLPLFLTGAAELAALVLLLVSLVRGDGYPVDAPTYIAPSASVAVEAPVYPLPIFRARREPSTGRYVATVYSPAPDARDYLGNHGIVAVW